MESHVQIKTLRNLTPRRGKRFLREGGLCLSHLSGSVRLHGLRQRQGFLSPSVLNTVGTLNKL